MDDTIRILLAEDNINDVKLLEKEFTKNGMKFSIHVVDNDSEYRKALEEIKPDIILSDYTMPVFDGLTALRIRMEKAPMVPFIIVTGSIDEITAVECIKAGADDYVLKERIHRIYPAVKSALRTRDLNLEKEKAQRDLIESEYKYRTLIDNLAAGVYQVEPSGKLLQVNPAFLKIMGYYNTDVDLSEEMSKHSAWEFYPDPQIRKDFLTAVKENGEVKNVEMQMFNYAKKLIWVNVAAKGRFDNEGNLLWVDGVLEDISIRKAAEIQLIKAKEKAEEASRVKSSFLANMSHEIRTPLNGILGFTEILKEDIKDKEQLHCVNVIEKSGKRLLETLDLILNFSKLEAESVTALYKEVNIINIVKDVMNSFEEMAKSKDLYFQKEISVNKLTAHIDKRFLMHVLNNLLKNAIVYTKKGGITLSLDANTENMIFKVKDTGIGIVKEKQKIIFEPFRQESEGYGRNFEGTGLGLSIAKRFVEMMKGSIEVESEIGKGSTFTVTIPLTNKGEPRKKDSIKYNEELKSSPQISFKQKKAAVLIVENDEDNLLFAVSVLKKHFEMDTAVEGYEAIDKAQRKVYDIILMDINLGKGIDGIQTVKEIRKLKGYEATPIVALTAYTRYGDKEEFLEGGCTHYLGKPFKSKQLLDLCQDIIKSQ